MSTGEELTTFEVSLTTLISENTSKSFFYFVYIIFMRFIKQIYTFISKKNIVTRRVT